MKKSSKNYQMLLLFLRANVETILLLRLTVGFKHNCLTFTLYLNIIFNMQHWNYFAFIDSLLDSNTSASTEESKHCWYNYLQHFYITCWYRNFPPINKNVKIKWINTNYIHSHTRWTNIPSKSNFKNLIKYWLELECL